MRARFRDVKTEPRGKKPSHLCAGCTIEPRDNPSEKMPPAAPRGEARRTEIDASGHDGGKVHGRNTRGYVEEGP